MIKVNIHNKNYTLIKEIKVDGVHVPRVGEIISLHRDDNLLKNYDGPYVFFVYDVSYSIENNVLEPEINCRQWFEGDRKAELQEQGWL